MITKGSVTSMQGRCKSEFSAPGVTLRTGHMIDIPAFR
jgi:hypothetical protein